MEIKVKNTSDYKVRKVFKSPLPAIRYMMHRSSDESWYDLDADINAGDGWINDIHVFTLATAVYVVATIKGDTKTLEALAAKDIQFRPSIMGIDLTREDYEQEREIAESILGYRLDTVKITGKGEIEELEPITKVIFRKYRNGDVIAVFPEIPTDLYSYDCLSYMTIGQHAACNWLAILEMTTPCKDANRMIDELENRYGYRLDIKQKYSRKMLENLQAEQKRIRTQ